MASKPKRPRDSNQLAKMIVGLATGQMADTPSRDVEAALRLGGVRGGAARAAKLTSEQRSEIARKGATARWSGKNS